MTIPEDALAELRARAEARLRAGGEPPFDEVFGRALEELEVHRAELEIQNEELRHAKVEVDVALDRYVTLFENAPVGLMTLTPGGVVRKVNPMALHLFGAAEVEPTGSPLEELVTAGHRTRLRRHLDHLVAGEIGERCDLELRALGSSRMLRLQGRVQPDEAELEVFIVVTDVTSLRSTEAALAGERELTERLLDTLPLVAVVLDCAGQIVRVNRWLEQLSGRPAESLLGADWFETFIPPRAREESRAVFAAAIAGQAVEGTVTPLVTPAGDERLVEWHERAILEADGTVSGVLVVGLDVTRARKLEEAARHAQKMEAVGTLAAGVAHDFNNLLMGMVGVLGLAIGQIRQDEHLREMLEMIRDRAKAGTGTVSQLMAFSRRDPVEPVERVIDDAVREMEPMLGMLLGADVRLDADLDAPGARVRLDEGQIEQILTNLAANARHAMPRGGTLRIRTSLVHLDTPTAECPGALPGEHVLLEVQDTGTGMDDATRQRVFEPFFTTKATGEGTGLGLSMVYGIAQRAGGCVRVTSAIGSGTTFHLWLPRARESQARIAMPPAQLPLATGQTVLLVEDAPMVRLTVRHFLLDAGFRVLEAEDAAQALDLWREHRSDIAILLSDVVLPGLQAHELDRRVKADEPDLPTVWMSAHPRAVLEAQGRIAPSAPLLRKPFGEPELRFAVANALGDRRRRRPGHRPS